MNDRSNMIKVAVVGGEGIGPEVTAQSQRVLNWFAANRGVPMVLREAQYGIIPYLATGKVMPPDTVEAMEEADAILWGATGGPETKEVPAAARKAGSLLGLRSKYDLYANLRPIVAHPALADSAPLKASVLRDVDFVIIRELTSGIYFGEPRGIETLADGQRRGFNTEQYTTNQIRRVARSAFELARTRRNKVCSVDKANVLETSVLWREEVIALHAAEFSDVELTHMYVDNAAMQIVREPGAIRCHGHRQYLRRHPVRLRGDGVRLARHAAVGFIGPGRQVRTAQGALRAGPWQRARYRRQGHCQPAWLHPQRRHDAAHDAQPARGCGPPGKGRGRCLVRRRANRRYCRGGSKAAFNAGNGRRGAERAGESRQQRKRSARDGTFHQTFGADGHSGRRRLHCFGQGMGRGQAGPRHLSRRGAGLSDAIPRRQIGILQGGRPRLQADPGWQRREDARNHRLRAGRHRHRRYHPSDAAQQSRPQRPRADAGRYPFLFGDVHHPQGSVGPGHHFA